MLCFFVYFRRLLDFFRGIFPLLFEQVASNMWIELLKNFTVGNIGSMFLASITVIFFELSRMTLWNTAVIAAVGGK